MARPSKRPIADPPPAPPRDAGLEMIREGLRHGPRHLERTGRRLDRNHARRSSTAPAGGDPASRRRDGVSPRETRARAPGARGCRGRESAAHPTALGRRGRETLSERDGPRLVSGHGCRARSQGRRADAAVAPRPHTHRTGTRSRPPMKNTGRERVPVRIDCAILLTSPKTRAIAC